MGARSALVWKAVLALALSSAALAAERWKMQYLYDADQQTLRIADIKFPTATRGIAVGVLTPQRGRRKPVALLTSDGGDHWTQVKLDEFPVSLFFLNENTGWMVTVDGLCRTDDAGKTWKKIHGFKKILQVWFADQNRGWAAGFDKTVLETTDGGKSWKPLEAAAKPEARKEYTTYSEIAFADSKDGIIAGGAVPPRADRSRLPVWLDPEKASKQREWPTLTILLQTRDGGKSWEPSTAPLFGNLESLSLAPDGNGLAVFGFHQSFQWPSEVYRLDLKTGKSYSVFREKDRVVTDAIVLPGGKAFLAAIEPPGRVPDLPVPGKLIMLSSTDLKAWQPMDVDYRAVAQHATLAVVDPTHAWVATDTGMILKLVSQ